MLSRKKERRGDPSETDPEAPTNGSRWAPKPTGAREKEPGRPSLSRRCGGCLAPLLALGLGAYAYVLPEPLLCRLYGTPASKVVEPSRFGVPEGESAPTVRVAVVGGGIAGLTAAYTLEMSNRARAAHAIVGSRAARAEPLSISTPGGFGYSDAQRHAPRYEVTLLEGAARVGGHSWTVPFPCRACGAHYRDGTHYPVDAGYAYNPTMPSYQGLSRDGGRRGPALSGPRG